MSDKKKVLGKDVRVLIKMGGSLVLSVPHEYIEAHGLSKGDKMTVFYNDIFHAEPVTDEEILKKVKRRED